MNVIAQSDVGRETYLGISSVGYALFYLLVVITLSVLAYGIYRRFSRYAQGDDDPFTRLDDLPGRIVGAARTVITNEKNFNRDLYGGLMHSFILWGFLTLFIATLIIGFQLYATDNFFDYQFWQGDFYLSYQFIVDAMGLLFVVGIGMAIYRRYWVRNHRLWGRHTSNEDDIFIWTLFGLGVGGFLLEGARIYATGMPDHEVVSFVGYGIAMVFHAIDVPTTGAAVEATLNGADYSAVSDLGYNAETIHWLFWWSHSLLALFFIAWIPYAKPFHMISSFANVVTADEKAGKRLPNVPSDLDATNAESIEDFTWKEILDQDACTKCGRCSSVCPAKASDRPLDPRNVILDLKKYREDLDAGGEEKPIIADGGTSVINTETMESCMACMACMDACPVDIEHLQSFTRLNRQMTDQGDVAPSMQDVFQNVMQNGNTFGDSPRNRGDWSDDLEFDVPDAREEEVDYLWYVGDFPSYDERNKQVARSLATILKEADVSFGILFDDEKYDGNDIRRVGEELLYVELAGHHVETWEDCEFDTIVCTDPHSYNTFKNEYPELNFDEFADDPMMPFEYDEQWNEDGEIEVYHWTQAVEELVQEGKLELSGTELDYTVTYHDPCHLGRYNDEYEAPRELIRATGCELDEMPRNRDNSFCCGGGGGGLWMDFEEDPKPSEERLREALEDTDNGPDVEKFVVACPMCMTMYEDGRKTGGYEDEIEIVDVAELIVEAIGAEEEADLEVAAD
ncbi:heterodisulfide reductase-related iron-sulfur binding cluster [Natronolimnohabitans sp. A-GB9]|uniref:heterodisulfide reductase-related iron-sulfur binding cluster n=1 Tax=Natronolimnohabitans sp. A-GB9 TaxID=3069757 RepID=UPI0027AE0670|nr:heterodisulfide reductase-related iron-sulfur binding cluster [Natronolimnohabitans sp. A-GB9]MDQ2050238.1 heterodisulfide reductase-related iron-sulfur binding cluster [Natronolimnohabitans sp. A-GB9]